MYATSSGLFQILISVFKTISFQQEKEKLESCLNDLKTEFGKVQKDLIHSTSKADELERIKDQLSIQIQILQTRSETEKRALKVELEADHEQKLVKVLEEQRNKFSSEQQTYRERLRVQIDDLNKRYNENMEKMMKKYNEEMEKNDEKMTLLKQDLEEELNTAKERNDQIEIEKNKLEKKMTDISRRLQLIVKANYDEVLKVLNDHHIRSNSSTPSTTNTALSSNHRLVENLPGDNLNSQEFYPSDGRESNPTHEYQNQIKNFFNIFQSGSKIEKPISSELTGINIQEKTLFSPDDSSVLVESSFPLNSNFKSEATKLIDSEFKTTFDRLKILTNEEAEINDKKNQVQSLDKISSESISNSNLSKSSSEERNNDQLPISIAKPAVSNSTSFSSFEVPAESVDYLFNSSTFKHYMKEKEKSDNLEFHQPEFADNSNISLSDKDSQLSASSSTDQRQRELKQYIGMVNYNLN